MSHASISAECLNCTTELQGSFCHSCGQKASSMHITLHDVAHDAVHEFLHVDGKIVNTLRLLVTRPGALTQEFIAGRRARYITPIRLYLTFSVIFFALSALLPGMKIKVVRTNAPTELSAADRKMATDVSEALQHNAPRAMFVLMPVFAGLTWLLFRKQQKYYIPHLYHSIHFHTFVFVVMTVAALLGAIGPPVRSVAGALMFVTLPYHYLSLRRVFGGAVRLRGTLVIVLYLFVIVAALLGLVLAVRG